MNNEWELTKEEFDRLLAWLDSDREKAGVIYETIRCRLIKIFARRGCWEAENLADETINRVATKIESISTQYTGNPALYFYGVARKIHHEYLRLRQRPLPEFSPVPNPFEDEEYDCLDQCLEGVNVEDRDLILRYYLEDKRDKIDHRRQLAEELGIAINALRIRAHRIRKPLKKCVQECVHRSRPVKRVGQDMHIN
jgi:RNA polymerase sigma factor (sigma-70 family)